MELFTVGENNDIKFLGEELEGYFGDQYDDQTAIQDMKGDLVDYPEYAQKIQLGLEQILSNPKFSCLPFVKQYANRSADNSEEKARAWLTQLKYSLFG
ncbi:MAG: hypothetical protein M1421_03570 [Candidatus Eremiobacteraeota bacterium]|nr:hypothetical protein [Candidatus Eremiobacteraeota bacterium]